MSSIARYERRRETTRVILHSERVWRSHDVETIKRTCPIKVQIGISMWFSTSFWQSWITATLENIFVGILINSATTRIVAGITIIWKSYRRNQNENYTKKYLIKEKNKEFCIYFTKHHSSSTKMHSSKCIKFTMKNSELVNFITLIMLMLNLRHRWHRVKLK